MTALWLALTAGLGTHLLAGALLSGRRDLVVRRLGAGDGPGPVGRARDWLVQAGLVDVRLSEFAAVTAVLFVLAFAAAWGLLGGVLPAAVVGAAAATTPWHLYRSRRRARLIQAQETWPRLIEEIRVHTLSLGRSVPQALFDAGLRAPAELRPAFEAAHREWLLSVDFARTLDVLRDQLADPTADAACETLLVAHEVGGTDLGQRLEALAEDRLQDALGRKDARAEQAGVRFARRFVLVVPAGMALAGSLVGGGRRAYATPTGQVVVLVAIGLVGVCWVWAGRYLRLPEPTRVFRASFGAAAAADAVSSDPADPPQAGVVPPEGPRGGGRPPGGGIAGRPDGQVDRPTARDAPGGRSRR